MIFYSISQLPKKKCYPTKPSHFLPKFSLGCDVYGNKVLIKSGQVDAFADIQLFKDECSLASILRRYQLGDTTVLNRSTLNYGDSTSMPSSLQDALNLDIKLRNDFNAFKPELKSLFNNDYKSYLASLSDGSLNSILEQYNKTLKEEKSDE